MSAVLGRARPAARDRRATGVIATVRGAGPSVRCLLTCAFVNQAGAFVQAFLVLFLVGHGVGEGRAGLALGAYGLGSVAGALLGGDLGDRIGHRTTIVLAMTGSAVLTVLLGYLGSAADYPALLAVATATGAVTQTYRPAAMALLARLVPDERVVMTFSMYRIALNLGAVIGPLVAASLISVSWDLLFWADGLTSCTCGLLALRFLPGARSVDRPTAGEPSGSSVPSASALPSDPSVASTPGEPSGALGPSGPSARSEPAEPPAASPGYRALIRDRRFVLYLVAMFASALIYMQYFSALPLKLRAEAYPSAVYSAVLALSAALVITSELFVTSRVQRWRTTSAAGGGIALLAIGLAAYGPAGGLVLLFAATLVGVVGQMVSGPTMFAHPPRVAPEGAAGHYTGAAHAMFGLGTAAGPFVGVLLWNRIGGDVWLLCGAVGLLAAAAAVSALSGAKPRS